MKLAIGILATVVSLNANAAVSGYYDSAKKIEIAMAVEGVAFAFGQAPIKNISVNGLEVTIESEDCRVGVTLKTVPSEMIGPMQYEVDSITKNLCP